ncbi:class II fumarate hydratase [Polycyclovorans algicola]|uniref:class II fumarate hydratase n=1 Tax=Polycyclovorans algicola TaxID=616992 RepID=UPI000693B659|nr:class II fumarate hydratase [Polycyclovorans algicola]
MTGTATLWGSQTQLAVENFPISGERMHPAFIRALAAVKAAAAGANRDRAVLASEVADAVIAVADAIAAGEHADQFPVDVFQTGSGTSTNMNANEVIAALASRALGQSVHPNDHVNASQSSNDIIPTTAHVAAAVMLDTQLLPALSGLRAVIQSRVDELGDTIKTGRTHLMDAMPVSLGQELSGWAQQVASAEARLGAVQVRLHRLAVGGTAVGTGLNTPPGFADGVCAALQQRYGLAFRPAENYFEALASVDTLAELSGQLKVLAGSLMKVANDLRWMNSGPLAGLGEIALPALQAGSSIMPGKVNPVIPEAVCMVCARVIGNDATVTIAAQSGNFQLNVMWPVAIHSVLNSLTLLSAACQQLGAQAIARFTVNQARLADALRCNPILVTALNSRIGYEAGSRIAKRAYAEGRPVLDVAEEDTGLSREELSRLLDPAGLIRPADKPAD